MLSSPFVIPPGQLSITQTFRGKQCKILRTQAGQASYPVVVRTDRDESKIFYWPGEFCEFEHPYGQLTVYSSVAGDVVTMDVGYGQTHPEGPWSGAVDWSVVTSGPYTGAGGTVIYGPPSGYRYIFKGYRIDMSLIANLGGGNPRDITLDWYDGTTPLGIRHVVTVPGTKGTPTVPGVFSMTFRFPENDFFRSQAINTALILDMSDSLSDGGICVVAEVANEPG